MRIGIEALHYYDDAPSVKRVLQNIIHSLLECDKENDYTIFISKKRQNETFPIPTGAKVKVVYIRTGNLKYNTLVKPFLFPYLTYREKLDVMLYQFYPAIGGRGKCFTMIYDVLFEEYPHLFPMKEKIYLTPLKYFTRFADGIITISKSERERLLRYGYMKNPDKVDFFLLAAAPNFKSLEKHDLEKVRLVKEKYKIDYEYILFVGFLSARKNLDNLLRSMPHIIHPVKLLIVGDPNHLSISSNHTRLIRECELASRVKYTGFVDDEDLSVLFACAKVFCFPTFAEGFGLPPLEALASGVPVAVSNNTSLPEVCGEAGTYFNPHKPEEIANAISKLLEDSAYYHEKRIKALEQAAKFSWQKSAEKVIQILTN